MKTYPKKFWTLNPDEAAALVLPSGIEGLRPEDEVAERPKMAVFRGPVGRRFAKALPTVNVSVTFLAGLVGARVGLLTAKKEKSPTIHLVPEPPSKNKGGRLPWHVLWFPTHVHGTDLEPLEVDRVLASCRQLRQFMDDDRYAWLRLSERCIVFPQTEDENGQKLYELLDDYFRDDDRVAWAPA